MYADVFGLRELPFNNTPDPRFFYSTPDHEEALASLIYAVKQRKGFVLITGEVGAGKTLVSRLMLRQFGNSIVFANINHAVRSAADLMESLCIEFELPVDPGTSHVQMTRALHDFLLARFAQNVPVVLVLDEAQNLPVQAFEQLRMIGNLEADDAKLLQIAILGQPELQRLFQSPELRQLKQRLFSSYHLPALDRGATEAYIRYRLSVAGARHTNLFPSAAVDKIFEASRGLPRLINTLCDNAMLSAYSAGKRTIDVDMVASVVDQFLAAEKCDQPGRWGFHPEAGASSIWQAPYGTGGLFGPGAPPAVAGHPYWPNVANPPAPYAAGAMRYSGVAAANLPSHPTPTGTRPAAPASPPVGGEYPGIRERLKQAKAHATRLELRYAPGTTALREALGAEANLKSTTTHAETILRRIETASCDLDRREKSLRSLSASVRHITEQLTRLLGDVRTTSEATKREHRRVAAMHERLLEHSGTSEPALENAKPGISGRIRSDQEGPITRGGRPTLLQAATALAEENRQAAGTIDPRQLGRILSQARKSSGDLRTLARGFEPATASPGQLEQQVENLAAAMIAQGA